jgi:ABC-type multidrug transport system permease subunit
MFKRIFYSYFLRDFNVGSLELVLAFLFMGFGIIFGSIKWAHSIASGLPATAGTVILAGLPVILGFQAFLSFLHFDLTNVPQKPLSGIEE